MVSFLADKGPRVVRQRSPSREEPAQPLSVIDTEFLQGG